MVDETHEALRAKHIAPSGEALPELEQQARFVDTQFALESDDVAWPWPDAC